jgi:hypothetical protein
MAKLKNANTNNGETHNTQTKYWRSPKSYMTVMKVLFKMMCGVFHISANKEESGLT